MKKLMIGKKEYQIEDEVSDLIILISKERDDLLLTLSPISWKCFIGFHNWTFNDKTRACNECNGAQEQYRCGASDVLIWRWIL